MDDLWANAWGSPDNVKDERTTTSEKSKDNALQEDDLSMPSWSTGPGIQWNEPSDTQSSLWSQHTQDWSLANPYSDIPPAPPRLAELPDDKDPAVELVVEPEPHSTRSSPQIQSDGVSAHSPSPSKELDEEVSPSPRPSPAPSPSPESSPPSSPDAFGTFTVGTEHSDITPFTTATGASFGGKLDDNNWDSPWGSAPKDVEGESAHHPSDEWESAKLRQLEMDRRVPPELLSQILLHVEELSNDAWPETQDVVEQDWQKRWHSGMDITGLDNLLLRYIPTLTLPQLLTSGRSFTAKAMADAVKLSRNSAVACTSPMSTFLAAKGSTAWETSVKSRIETSVDEVPSGWRILEKDSKKDEKVDERVKKPAGLLAGLWSRRASSSPNNPPSQERTTPPPDSTAPENTLVQVQSQRSSMESVRSSGTLPTSQALPQLSHSRAPSQVLAIQLPSPSLALSPADSVAQDEDMHVSPPGSAVSRFLKRFSRPRVSPSRNSLALSNDDLEYLSDVRSDSADPVHPVDDLIAELGSATGSTGSGFLQEKLPPPLPPPPNMSASYRVRTPARDAISAVTPFNPNPIMVPDSQPISPNSGLSPSDKLTSSPNVSLLPASTSQTSPVMGSPLNAKPQLPLVSGHTAQSFDGSQDDNDDFSDFRSSPADPPLVSLSLNFSSPTPGQGQFTSSPSNSPFDDLVHLMSSPTAGIPNTVEEPNPPRPFSLGSQALQTAPSPPPPPESTPAYRTSLDHADVVPTHTRSWSQRATSPPTVTPTSPKQKAITHGHQRTQSLLDLAAARKGRWPAPPSPLPEPLLPPPPPSGRSEGIMNVDYFGTTPIKESFDLLSPLPPPGKTSPVSSLSDTTSPQVGSTKKDLSPTPDVFGSISGPPSGSPSLPASAPPTRPSTGRALSPPPLPTAVMTRSLPKPSSTPVPLLPPPVPLIPPPGGYGFAAPPKPESPAPLSPESTPLALFMDGNGRKNVSLPVAKVTPPRPPPVKGTGGLSAQDLSFFEGL